MEHLVLVEHGLRGRIEKRLTEPPDPEKYPFTSGTEGAIPVNVPERIPRMVAPRSVTPQGQWSTDQLFGNFQEARERTIVFAREIRLNLHDYLSKHPRLGEMDCYQLLIFISSHSERHARQID